MGPAAEDHLHVGDGARAERPRDEPPRAAEARPEGTASEPDEDEKTGPALTPREADRLRDLRLVERALAGDLDAFNHLVVLYQDYLHAVAARLIGDWEAADDAVQEAFFSAYRHLRSFRGEAFRAWLTRITVNAATDVLRARQRRPSQPYPEFDDDSWEPPAGESADPEREALRRAQARVLSNALAQLTEGQRTSIVLFDVEGFDYPEIAAMTGVSLGTVKSRIHRGRLAMRDLLGDAVELLRS